MKILALLKLSTKEKVFLATLLGQLINLLRGLAGYTYQAKVQRRKIRWDLDLNEGIDLSIYIFGGFELGTLKVYEKLIRKGDVVVDIGANIGSHTLPLAQISGPKGKVFAFEPTSYAYQKLQKNMALNPKLAKTITALQGVILNSKKTKLPKQLYSSWPLTGDSRTHPLHKGKLTSTEGAKVFTLDSFFIRQKKIKKINFIKLDVDGNEESVLSGAKKTIQKYRPVILIEAAPHLYRKNIFFKKIILPLLRQRYNILDNKTLKPISPQKRFNQIKSNGSENIVLMPHKNAS
jgi:FkbM family methyltransferase